MGLSYMFALLLFLAISVGAEEPDLYSKLISIENIVRLQGIRIQELEGTVNQQQAKIDRLNRIVHKFRNEDEGPPIYAQMDNSTNNGSSDKEEIKEEFSLRKDSRIKNRQSVRVSRLLIDSVPVQPSTVAFYVYLGQHEANIGQHHSLIFDVIVTNLGDGYNKEHLLRHKMVCTC